MIWVETWEEVSLSENEQSELYEELISWAKRRCFDPVSPNTHSGYSQRLTTG